MKKKSWFLGKTVVTFEFFKNFYDLLMLFKF